MPLAPKVRLSDLTIVIPSSGRSDRQITLEQLPDSVLSLVKLAVPESKVSDYSGWNTLLWSIPNMVKGISSTRKYLMENCKTRYLAMLDDDMVFAYREDMSSPKLTSHAIPFNCSIGKI